MIEDYAFAQAQTMGADPGGIAMAALAVCAAATPDRIKLMMKRRTSDWIEEARLWVALVGLPSAKKARSSARQWGRWRGSTPYC